MDRLVFANSSQQSLGVSFEKREHLIASSIIKLHKIFDMRSFYRYMCVKIALFLKIIL